MKKHENLNLFGPLNPWHQKQGFTTTYNHDFVNHFPSVKINRKLQIKTLPKIEKSTVKLPPISTKFDRLPPIEHSNDVNNLPSFAETRTKGHTARNNITSIKSRYAKLPQIIKIEYENPVEKENSRMTGLKSKIDKSMNIALKETKQNKLLGKKFQKL